MVYIIILFYLLSCLFVYLSFTTLVSLNKARVYPPKQLLRKRAAFFGGGAILFLLLAWCFQFF